MNPASALISIEHWVNQGWLSRLDQAFAKFLQELDPQAEDIILWAGALVSHQLGRGEVFLDLEKLADNPGLTLAIPSDEVWQQAPDEQITQAFSIPTGLDLTPLGLSGWKSDSAYPSTDSGRTVFKDWINNNWLHTLNQSPLVATGAGNSPLVLKNQRLYLRRYWQYQQVLNKHIHLRLQPLREQLLASLQQTLQTLFKDNKEQPDWQKIACVLALRARFAIITGGPGTGKTTTLTKLLSLLIELTEQEQQRKLTILLAAPTGKAAARVSESIANALQDLPVAARIKQQIPKQASTLHRLLGSRPDSRRFKHDHHQPLLADIVIVDEASMIDLEMMASLLDALPDTAQLILLGDKDQLASVEAGSVMGDLCHGAEWAAYDADTLDWIAKHAQQQLPVTQNPGSAINQQTIMLRHSHRFSSDSGIGELARAVNAGDVVNAERILSASQSYSDLQRIGLSSPSDNRLKQLIIANGDKPGYGDYVQLLQQPPIEPNAYEKWAQAVLLAFDRFQVLSALRGGDWGVAGLNQRIEHWLFPDKKPGLWYAGRPVMITRNDYNLGLMNGDIGMTLTDADQKLRVAFPGETGSIRWVSPLRLPDVETAFAMTVHKSQGSEFQHVALVLPEVRSPVLTRELIYTGITRARKYFSLLETRPTVLAQAIENRRK